MGVVLIFQVLEMKNFPFPVSQDTWHTGTGFLLHFSQ